MKDSFIDSKLDEIFNVPKNGSNIKDESDESSEESHDVSYAEVSIVSDNLSFDDKAKVIKNKIKQDGISEDVEFIAKKEGDSYEPVSRAVKQSEPLEEILSKSLKSNDNNKTVVKETVLLVADEQKPVTKDAFKQEDAKNADQDEINLTTPTEIYDEKPNSEGWTVTSPSPMYNQFYVQKLKLIHHITKTGKQLDFEKLNLELKKSTISVAIDLNDIVGMAEKLTSIQQFLDRVVQIKIQATSQCASARRGVELLRGVLANIQYEKPAARQDGLIYNHMKDIEIYATELESLEQNAKDVYHNLLEAKEILSRKISISLELKKSDNLEKHYNSIPDNIKKEIIKSNAFIHNKNEYDALQPHEIIKSKHKEDEPAKTSRKTGLADW